MAIKFKKARPVKEVTVHTHVTRYIKWQYRTVSFRTDFAAGIKLPIGLAVRQKEMQSERAWADLFLSEPRQGYHGMYLELKRDGEKIYKRDGVTPRTPHLAEQMAFLEKMRAKGYYAQFAIGFDDAKKQIDEYLKLPA